jgi:hypothetical protein
MVYDFHLFNHSRAFDSLYNGTLHAMFLKNKSTKKSHTLQISPSSFGETDKKSKCKNGSTISSIPKIRTGY